MERECKYESYVRMLGSSIWAIVKTGLTGGLPLCFVICYIVIKGDRTMSLMSPAMHYSSLFGELSRMEEFRNKRSIENRRALLSQESPLPPDYNVRM